MKTFDEAIQVALPTAEMPQGAPLEKVLSQAEKLAEGLTRYGAFVAEARLNPHYRFMTNLMRVEILAGRMKMADAILSSFMAGLITGVEMEKGEVPMLQPEEEAAAPDGGYDVSIEVIATDHGPLLIIESATAVNQPDGFIALCDPTRRVGVEMSEELAARLEAAIADMREKGYWGKSV